MLLYRAAQMLEISDNIEEMSDDAIAVLNHEAELFAWSGLSSLQEWQALTQVEKAALVNAQERRQAAFALQVAQALSGPDGMFSVAERIDGGDSRNRMSLAKAVATAAKKYEGTVA